MKILLMDEEIGVLEKDGTIVTDDEILKKQFENFTEGWLPDRVDIGDGRVGFGIATVKKGDDRWFQVVAGRLLDLGYDLVY